MVYAVCLSSILPIRRAVGHFCRMHNNLENPFYYLENFQFVLHWVLQRYRDLLITDELSFIEQFDKQPVESRALLVRMVMRKGSLFRSSKLVYPEIGDTNAAVQPLIAQGWIAADSVIELAQLYDLLTKAEFAQALKLTESSSARKADLLEMAAQDEPAARPYSAWYGNGDYLYETRVDAICDSIRLMFFGNLHQDWSEFVLSHLGIYRYETVAFSEASRAFHTRADVDTYLSLHACRENLHVAVESGKELNEVEQSLIVTESSNSWLQIRRAKLLFQLGQAYEKREDADNALRIYALCDYPGARSRRIRVLEKNQQTTAALELAKLAQAAPENAAEVQHLQRILPRLHRKTGSKAAKSPAKFVLPRMELLLPPPQEDYYVEELALQYFADEDASAVVHYVENTLINSLLGLLFWDVIFSDLPGAFFHPFQSGPADLHSADFIKQRAQGFQQSLAQLQTGQYLQTIRDNFARKSNMLSPFVYWGALTETLLEQALTCLPPAHLAHWFTRILDDIGNNRSGFPDLIQFWPEQKRYRMIEIKGPGDRLQDNQIRFLDFCMQHDMPVAVCHVAFEEDRE
jgi:hypothetical protein